MEKLVSGLFKIVCATCPAHAVIHESVRYQDGLLVHYECHDKEYLVAMYPHLTRAIVHKDGGRWLYAFNVVKPDVSCLHEPIECVYVLDTELEPMSPERIAEMHKHLSESLPIAEVSGRPSFCETEEAWIDLLAEGRKTLALLARFVGKT